MRQVYLSLSRSETMPRNEATKGERSIDYRLLDCGWRNLYWRRKNPSPNKAKVRDTIGSSFGQRILAGDAEWEGGVEWNQSKHYEIYK